MNPSFGELSTLLEQAVSPVTGRAEPPRDSIAGAVLALQHTVIDGVVGAVPRTMRTGSQADHSKSPVQVTMRGQNSQGLASLLLVSVEISLRGARIEARLTLFAQDQRPVARLGRAFQVSATDSMKSLVKQFADWLSQAEALQMAPVGVGGVAVQMAPPGSVQPPGGSPAASPMGAGMPL